MSGYIDLGDLIANFDDISVDEAYATIADQDVGFMRLGTGDVMIDPEVPDGSVFMIGVRLMMKTLDAVNAVRRWREAEARRMTAIAEGKDVNTVEYVRELEATVVALDADRKIWQETCEIALETNDRLLEEIRQLKRRRRRFGW